MTRPFEMSMAVAAARTGAAGGGNLTTIPEAQKDLGRETLVGGYMAGMETMQQRFGKLKWADLFAPAIYYAENGVTLNKSTAGYFAWRKRFLERTPEGRAFLTAGNDEGFKPGTKFVQPEAAKTLRAVAGDPENLQIMYGIAGERELGEAELDWLPGYENSGPVRVGNGAANQLQLDVYGEVTEALHLAHMTGLTRNDYAMGLQLKLIEYLEKHWEEPDEGIWEVRGPRRHFVHSKVMAWVAVDRTIKLIEAGDADGPLERWLQLRDDIHRDVCERGYDKERNTFTQSYGSKELDASLLLIPQMGFLPPDDKRVIGTIEAIQRELSTEDGFVLRYPTDGDEAGVDGLEGDEGAFLACSFWLADDLAMIGRVDEARQLFEKLLSLRNDLGLLAEEWDSRLQRQVGNFPQAFSHVPLIDTALRLTASGAYVG